MGETKGFIYILTNKSFDGYVKIGYANDVVQRVEQLNSSECTPYAFYVYATYEVDARLMDKKVHTILDKLNPSLRAVQKYNGRLRKREFFAISAEDAYSVFEAMAEIHGCPERLKKWDTTEEELIEEEVAEIIENERRERHSNYTFEYWNIPEGAELVHIDDPEIKCRVVDARRVEYDGEIYYMTPFVRKIGGKTSHGPGYVGRYFMYNGETLSDIEARLYNNE